MAYRNVLDKACPEYLFFGYSLRLSFPCSSLQHWCPCTTRGTRSLGWSPSPPSRISPVFACPPCSSGTWSARQWSICLFWEKGSPWRPTVSQALVCSPASTWPMKTTLTCSLSVVLAAAATGFFFTLEDFLSPEVIRHVTREADSKNIMARYCGIFCNKNTARARYGKWLEPREPDHANFFPPWNLGVSRQCLGNLRQILFTFTLILGGFIPLLNANFP